MSYILEALKRAEHERTEGQAADRAHASSGAGAGRIRPVTLALMGATLFLAGIGVAALLLRPAATPVTGVPAHAVVAPMPSRPPPAIAVEAAGDAISAYDDALIEPAPSAEPESLDDVTPVFQGAPVTVMPAAAPLTAPTPVPEAAARAAAGAADPGLPAMPPLLRDMPSDYRAQLPPLRLQVHVYDTDPARRWVMIDDRRYLQGTAVPGGALISEIVADGVVFEFRGERVLWPLSR